MIRKYQVNHCISRNIFRTYDIRGIVDENLDENNVYTIGRAFASEAILGNCDRVVVGRDGRLSGEKLLAALSSKPISKFSLHESLHIHSLSKFSLCMFNSVICKSEFQLGFEFGCARVSNHIAHNGFGEPDNLSTNFGA